MKNIKILKKLVVLMLSLVFVLTCSNVAFAADDDLFTELSNTNNSTSDGNALTGNNTNSTNNTNTNTAPLTTNSNTNTEKTNTNSNTNSKNVSTNRNVSNTNALANTGLSNTGSIIALIVVVCGVSAIYSYKKVNDYKKL